MRARQNHALSSVVYSDLVLVAMFETRQAVGHVISEGLRDSPRFENGLVEK